MESVSHPEVWVWDAFCVLEEEILTMLGIELVLNKMNAGCGIGAKIVKSIENSALIFWMLMYINL